MVTLDEGLVEQATALTGITEESAPVSRGLQTLVRVESARRLVAFGGSDPKATAAPRGRGQS